MLKKCLFLIPVILVLFLSFISCGKDPGTVPQAPAATSTITPDWTHTATGTFTTTTSKTVTPTGTITRTATATATATKTPMWNILYQEMGANLHQQVDLYVADGGLSYVSCRDGSQSDLPSVYFYSEPLEQWNFVYEPGVSTATAIETNVHIDGSNVYLSYFNDAINKPVAKVSAAGGAWADYGHPENVIGQAYEPKMAGEGGMLYIVCRAAMDGSKPYVLKGNGAGWEVLGSGPVTSGTLSDSDISVYNGEPYIILNETASSNLGVAYKYQNAAPAGWVALGPTTGITTAGAVYPDIFVSSAGVPYIAYMDVPTNRLTVRSFSGGTWNDVGGTAVSSASCYEPEVYVDGNVVYVAYLSGSSTGALKVMRYKDAQWTVLPDVALAAEYAQFPNIFVKNGIPYLAYMQNATGYIKLYKFY